MSSSATHYELSDWVDYVRRAGAPDRLAAMGRHLTEERCERCARLAQMLESAYGASRALAEVVVPEATLQRAQLVFNRAPERPWTDLAIRMGDWVQDLLLPGGGPGWALAGVRTAGAQRQRIYRSGSLEIRLEDERAADGQRIVTGVLSDQADPGAGWQGTRVLLAGGQHTLAGTVANEFGEFEIATSDAGKLRLVVVLNRTDERLEVALDS